MKLVPGTYCRWICRDSILGLRPKDCDVVTNATEEIKTVVKRTRIIGRRFKIVHARSERKLQKSQPLDLQTKRI